MYIQTPYSHYRFQKRHPSLLMKKIIAHERPSAKIQINFFFRSTFQISVQTPFFIMQLFFYKKFHHN